jgi:predicted nucleic acid-binding Zn finger protein
LSNPVVVLVWAVVAGFCTCRNFADRLQVSTVPICKHLLAVALSEAEGILLVQTVPDDEWALYATSDELRT